MRTGSTEEPLLADNHDTAAVAASGRVGIGVVTDFAVLLDAVATVATENAAFLTLVVTAVVDIRVNIMRREMSVLLSPLSDRALLRA
jgi:hypothetical protein